MLRRAAIENHGDLVPKIGIDVSGGGRADVARYVGGWRCNRQAGCLKQGMCNRMTGHADADSVETGADQLRKSRFGPPWKHQRQRPRPERRRQAPCLRCEPGDTLSRRRIGDVDDQRVEPRPALRFEDLRHRAAVGGVGAEPVDGLRRERDQPPGFKLQSSARNRGLARLDDGHTGDHCSFWLCGSAPSP